MASPEAAAPLEHPPLQGAALVLGTVALSLATFMNVLDSTIANVSLPAIAGDLGVSPSQGTWVVTSFGVANAISVPLTGWLTQRFGAVRLFTASVLLFVLASWACGLAHSLEALIAYRVLQGFVAGPMVPLSQTLLLASFPPARAGMAIAMWATTTLVAPVAGPLLGGWITDNFAWPWIFYINVPIGLFAAALTWSVYHKRESERRKLPIDTVGLVLLVLGIGSLQLMLDKGHELSWFESGQILTLAVVAVLGLVAFVIWELGDEHPVVDLHLFKHRNFTVGVLSNSMGYGLFIGNIVLLPLWLQQYMGYSATASGQVMAPMGMVALFVAPVLGRFMGRLDARMLGSLAFLSFSVVFYMRAQFTTDTDMWRIILPTLLQGAGVPLFFMPIAAVTLSGLAPQLMPAATGLSNAVRMTAGAMGTSIAVTLWEQRSTLHRAHLTELLTQGDSAWQGTLDTLQASGLPYEAALAQVNRLIDQQAYTRGMDDVFMLSSLIFLGLVGVLWLSTRPPRVAEGTGSADAAAAAAH
jgi:MFS transporter, DHA2 family, multidrug resistance protein